ncbi:MAG: SelL-related redox protein [Phycisphaerales bacterium]
MNGRAALTPPPGWTRRWLVAAGAYNLLWGSWVILFPNSLFDLTDIPRPTYPQIWQCVGMIVGVYGIGYLIASRNSRRHWPIVLVGLLGKIFGPLGFAASLARGDFPPAFGLTILTNDLLWWIPFSMMLWDAAKSNSEPHGTETIAIEEAMQRLVDQHGRSLDALSRAGTVLTIFARHSGCSFCREMLADLSKVQERLREEPVHLAIVTMSSTDGNAALAREFQLESASWISDPSATGYRAFGLQRGSFGQLFGPQSWVRGAVATLRGHRIGRLVGDGFQMPGAFLVEDGRIRASHRHGAASERVDFAGFACGVPSRG